MPHINPTKLSPEFPEEPLESPRSPTGSSSSGLESASAGQKRVHDAILDTPLGGRPRRAGVNYDRNYSEGSPSKRFKPTPPENHIAPSNLAGNDHTRASMPNSLTTSILKKD